MCGRARCTLNPAQVARACGLSDGAAAAVPTHQMDRHRPSFNVSPGSYMPVFMVRSQGGGGGGGPEEKIAAPVVHCMKWGLVPSFTKKTEKPDHFRMFNARSESIKEKASFRRLIPANRCVVAVEGFYEWKKDGSKKQPYYVHLKDDRPLVFAALYDSWGNSEGEILYTFTILTTRCSSSLEWLHDRMPVILGSQNSIDLWISNSTPKCESVFVPYDEPDLVWYPVTPNMGKPSFNGPECIVEIQLKPAVETPLLKFFSKKNDDKRQLKTDVHKSAQESPATNSPDRVKEEAADEEKVGKSDSLMPVKEEIAQPDICGTKHELEEIKTISGLTTEMFDILHPDPPKKKSKNLKNAGDGQASLLSFFRKKVKLLCDGATIFDIHVFCSETSDGFLLL